MRLSLGETAWIDIDLERTRRVNDSRSRYYDHCPCYGCTSARMTRRFATPAESELREQLGFDLVTAYACGNDWITIGRRSVHRIYDEWHVVGKMHHPEAARIVRLDARTQYVCDPKTHVQWWIDDEPEKTDGFVLRILRDAIDWDGSVGDLQQAVPEGPCPDCGFPYRESAYLKRKGEVPQMYDLPGLAKVMREKETRVLGIFCPFCGDMEPRIVRGRPYRKRLRRRDYEKADQSPK